MNEDIRGPYVPDLSKFWLRRNSKHAKGWITQVVNGGKVKRFKAVARRRALRKAS